MEASKRGDGGRGTRQVVAGDGSVERANVYYCRGCHRTLPDADGEATGPVPPASDPHDQSDPAASPAGEEAGRGAATPLGALIERNVLCVREELSLDALEGILVDRQVSAVPVVDEMGRLVGLVSASDVIRRHHDRGDTSETGPRAAAALDSQDLATGFHQERAVASVGDVMALAPSALFESCSLAGAARLMAELDLQQMPVVSLDRRVVGMVRSLDLLRWLAGDLHAPPVAPSGSAGAERRLHTVLSHAPIWVLGVDRHGTITTVEGRGPLAFGIGPEEGPEELVGQSVFTRFRDLPGFLGSCRLALAGHQHSTSFSPPKGERRWEAHFEPLGDAPGWTDGFVLVVLDVTESHRASDALERSEQRLIEAGRLAALGSLAGGVAHQINNALTYMRLAVGRLISLEQSLKPVTPVRQHRLEMLQDVREGIGRIERINSELAHFSRMDRGHSVPIDLAALLESVTRTMAHEIGHRARLTCDYRAVPAVKASPPVLRQVFLNLILNAVQSIPDGEAHLNEIRIVTRTDDAGRAVVEIGDTGSGIAPEVLPRIFEPFFTTRPVGQGMGLGLAVCSDTVKALGGEIAAESALGRGTAIRLTLPAAPPADEAAAASATVSAAATGARQTTAKRRRHRVLVVDDNLDITQMLRIELELDGMDVVVAHSGRDALDVLGRGDREFDVVLCDLMMPEVSGVDLYEAAKLLDADLADRFVFMTGGAFTERAAQFIDEVANPRIAKPFHVWDLLQMIRGPGAVTAKPAGDTATSDRPERPRPDAAADPESGRSRH